MNTIIVQHHVSVGSVKRHNKGYCGTVAAVRKEDKVYFGGCVCSPKDSYTRKKGRELAIKRAEDKKGIPIELYHMEVNDFIVRAMRYFKDVPFENFVGVRR